MGTEATDDKVDLPDGDEKPDRTEIEREARNYGWVPKEKFRGDPTTWVEAEVFIEKGKTVLPIVKRENARLAQALETTNDEVKGLKDALKSSAEQIKTLRDHSASEIKRQVEARIKDLKAERRVARRGEDDDRVDDIDEEIDELKDSLADRVPKVTAIDPPTKKDDPAPKIEPWAQAFYDDNKEWLDKDLRRRNLFEAEAKTLHAEGLRHAELLEAAKESMEKILGAGKRRQASKSEGGGHSGDGGGGGGSDGGKSFDDLPSDAKRQCKLDSEKLVGKGKAFETLKAWQDQYARDYFASV